MKLLEHLDFPPHPRAFLCFRRANDNKRPRSRQGFPNAVGKRMRSRQARPRRGSICRVWRSGGVCADCSLCALLLGGGGFEDSIRRCAKLFPQAHSSAEPCCGNPILLNGSLHLTSHPRIPRQMPIANKGRIAGGDGMYRSVSHEGNYKGLREAWLFRVRLIAQ